MADFPISYAMSFDNDESPQLGQFSSKFRSKVTKCLANILKCCGVSYCKCSDKYLNLLFLHATVVTLFFVIERI